jgi:hypothetical protein
MYIFGKWYLLHYLVDCQRAWLKWIPFQLGPLTVTVQYNKYHFPHICILPPDEGLLKHPKHV